MGSGPVSARLRRACRAAVVGVVVLGMSGTTAVPSRAAAGRFKEVARLPLFDAPANGHERSGWLVLNPVSRRGYQIVEVATPSAGDPRTIVRSFDLDTLQPLRRVVLAGAPVVGGTASSTGVAATRTSAEVVHAVDPEGRRLYLALSHPQAVDQTAQRQLATFGSPSDGRRALSRFVAIDEDALDRCGGEPGCPVVASFREPVGQERLHAYWVAGMAVARHHVAAGMPGRLLVLFAHPQPNGLLFYDHTLAQWEAPPAAAFRAGAELETQPTAGLATVPGQLAVAPTQAAGLPRRLDACSRASLASAGSFGRGTHQWGLLPLRDAVWTGCQQAEGSGAATRIPLDAAGNLDPLAPHEAHSFGARLADVLVDGSEERLYLRSYGGGDVLWVFDTAQGVFTGTVPLKPSDNYSAALGLHPATGRLYALVQDHEVFLAGVSQPVQGGLQYADPPGALTNVRPDLAYPAGYAIRVDPVTGRVFVRLGHQAVNATPVYPGTDATTPAPAEAFYRVFDDRVR